MGRCGCCSRSRRRGRGHTERERKREKTMHQCRSSFAFWSFFGLVRLDLVALALERQDFSSAGKKIYSTCYHVHGFLQLLRHSRTWKGDFMLGCILQLSFFFYLFTHGVLVCVYIIYLYIRMLGWLNDPVLVASWGFFSWTNSVQETATVLEPQAFPISNIHGPKKNTAALINSSLSHQLD